MSDEWRLRVDLHEDGPARALTEHLGDSILEHDLDTSFDGLVVVSREGPGVFCYTGTRQQAQKAEMLIHSLAADQGWHVDAELTRWHPSAEEWEEPDKPLLQWDLEHAAESPALVAREHGGVEEHGRPEFGVGMQCASHRQALQLIETLRKEGVPSVRRSKYILVGAYNEKSAHAVTERLRQEAPPGSIVITEEAVRPPWGQRSGNPFSVLGNMSSDDTNKQPRRSSMARRVLVLSNEDLADANEVPPAIRPLIDEADEIYVVAPVLTTWMQWLTDDRDTARASADERLRAVFDHMHAEGLKPHGEIGDENQVSAITDALAQFDADLILLRLHVQGSEHENRRERGIAEQVRAQFDVPTMVFYFDGEGHVVDREEA